MTSSGLGGTSILKNTLNNTSKKQKPEDKWRKKSQLRKVVAAARPTQNQRKLPLMKKRLMLVPLVVGVGILFLLGFLVDRAFLYVALLVGMVSMHLFGHGHRHETSPET